jgi:agmatinase
MWSRLPGCFALPQEHPDAAICIVGAPFDGTCSGHPGTRYAPQALREATDFLETYSPIQDTEIDTLPIIDVGDLHLPIGNPAEALAHIRHGIDAIYQAGQAPIMLGGEHLCSLPAIEAALAAHPDIVVLQFDAHSDLRDTYLNQRLSHATVMRRVLEQLKSHQHFIGYGIRSGLKEDFELLRTCRTCGPQGCDPLSRLTAFRYHLDAIKGKPLYITFDLDVFDPSEMPGTGTPEPGGIRFHEFIQTFPLLAEQRIVGIDIVELSPPVDVPSKMSAILAAKVLRELGILMHRSQQNYADSPA